MISKPKKTRVLSLSIIDKAMKAINDVGEIDEQVKDNIFRYNLKKVYEYYNEVVEELNHTFQDNKFELEKINHLYLLRERLYRIINPTIYLNAYKEKRANDALYINANVGFISEETNLEVLKKKIENDLSYIDSVKAKVIEKLLSKVNLDDMTIKNSKITRKKNEEMLIKNEHRLLKCQLNIDQKLQDIATINPALRDLVFSIHQEIEIILKITQKG
jgi:hypothetical protein